jgi:hypothetical protein
MRALFRHGLSRLVGPLTGFGRNRGRRGVAPALLALALAGTGCEGEGVGQLGGTLFVRGCPFLDPTTLGSRDVPSPLPTYTMNPKFFHAELQLSTRLVPSEDPPGPARMRLRMQTSSPKIERVDAFELFIYDLENLATRQASAMASGLAGMPITPPPLDVDPVPPPPDPASNVRASLVFNGSCDYPVVAPMLRGYVHFTEIGQNPGEILAGDFAVTVEDLRAAREQGSPAPSPDVAGALSGTFRFPIRNGPAAGAI